MAKPQVVKKDITAQPTESEELEAALSSRKVRRDRHQTVRVKTGEIEVQISIRPAS